MNAYKMSNEIQNINPNRCLLIVPPFQSSKASILGSFRFTMPPLGLLSIAAWLRFNKIETSILDFTVEDTKRNELSSLLQSHTNNNGIPNWIGISVCTPVAYNAYQIADICRQLYPTAQIVLGGPHITILKEKIFDECISADYLITEEGEHTLCDLILNNDLTPDNLYVRNSDNSIIKRKARVVDLEKLPMPAYDLLKFNKYIPPPSSLKSKFPCIGLITSRGCPYKCTFCTKISGSKLRFYSVEQIIEQIVFLKNKFHIKQFHFYDDTITAKREYIISLCNKIIESNIKIHWSCFARVDTVDREVLQIMKTAGCFLIMYGVESMDDDILLSIKKGITVNQIKNALKLTREIGIETRSAFIIGNPHDTVETLKKTKEAMLKLPTDFIQVMIAIPMPGSQFYLDAQKEGRLLSKCWTDFDLSKVVYRHPRFTEKELKKIQRQYYISFYLRFKIIFLYISQLNSLAAFKNILRGLRGFLNIISV